MIATLFPFLDFLYPACAAFGPFFLVMGILFRTSINPTLTKRASSLLVIGGVMITFCLLSNAPMGTPAPK